MVLAPINFISIDVNGTAYITGTKMKVRDIVMEKNAWGLTVEGIQRGHEHLSLAQIYAALSYYYENQAEIDAEIEQTTARIEAFRQQHPNPLTREQFEQRRQPA
jgi:uncharacterized protein (DUF433 family)